MKSHKRTIIFVCSALAAAVLSLAVYWVYYLHVAHSTFENYYNFRGCVQLVEKGDAYATCKLSSGQIIKIVQFDGKWYLDGDLPYWAPAATSPIPATTTPPATTTLPVSGTSSTPVVHSGIRGTVMLGPTCPVMRDPPDPACADRPYETFVAIFRANDPVHAAVLTRSNASGTFSATLQPGNYVLSAGESNLPRCDHPAITVLSGAYVPVTISCDTGIR